MPNDDLARSYAQAVYEKAMERWQKSLRGLSDTLQSQPALLPQLDNPAQPFERKKESVNRLLPADADAEVRNFVYLLASKNELHLLPQVLAEFDRFAARSNINQLARITSAVTLTADERTKLETKLKGQFGNELDFDYRVDPEIIGGVIVRVGDHIIDGSVAAKLAAMRQQLETAR